MPTAKFRFEGIDEFRALLRRLGNKLDQERKDMHADAATIVERDARPRVPVRTGRLKADVRSSGAKASGAVRVGRASVPYAGPVHYGWPSRPMRKWGIPGQTGGGPIAANLFLEDAVKHEEKAVVRSFENDVAAIIRKHGG